MDSHNISSSSQKPLIEFIQAMPKAEIHIHLEGAIEPKTVLALAKRHNLTEMLPSNTLTGLREWFTFRDFPHFVEIYFAISSLLRTPEDFELIAYECGADMHRQNIRYREITFTPYTHTHLLDKGVTIADIFKGLEAGRTRAKHDFDVEMRWIFDIPRNTSFRSGKYDASIAEQTLDYAIAGREYGVVGLGLGGYEVGAPPEPFAHAFDDAVQAGLLSVPHAGETLGPQSVWGAIDQLNASRIGHGVRSIEDPALLKTLQERQIVLEINPTSNICLHVYRRAAEHPFPHLHKMGLQVTLNSDDPALFNTTLSAEYNLLATEFGYSETDLAHVARNSFVACGAPPPLKDRLLTEFDHWVEEHPSFSKPVT